MENIPNSSASSTTPGPQSATPPMSSAVRVVLRFVRWLIRSVGFFYFVILLTLSDLLLVLLNLLSRPRPSKGVVPPPFSPSSPPPFGEQPILHLLCRLAASLGAESGKGPDWLQEWTTWSGVGWQGDWGPATMPGPGHSRSPCPAINALANQGILPINGRRVTPQQLAANMSRVYNLSPTLAIQLVSAAAPLWEGRDSFDLEDLCAHGVIEHDASLFRPDQHSTEQESDPKAQTHPWPDLIDRFLPPGLSPRPLTSADMSSALTLRRLECRTTNGQYHLPFLSKIFGSGNLALLLLIFRGSVPDLRQLCGAAKSGMGGVGAERIPHGAWQPNNRQAWGLTILDAQRMTVLIEAQTGLTDRTRIVQSEPVPHLPHPADKH